MVSCFGSWFHSLDPKRKKRRKGLAVHARLSGRWDHLDEQHSGHQVRECLIMTVADRQKYTSDGMSSSKHHGLLLAPVWIIQDLKHLAGGGGGRYLPCCTALDYFQRLDAREYHAAAA